MQNFLPIPKLIKFSEFRVHMQSYVCFTNDLQISGQNWKQSAETDGGGLGLMEWWRKTHELDSNMI
jgi:hypothetical protein